MCDLVEEYVQNLTQDLQKKLADKDAKLAQMAAEIAALKKLVKE